MFSINDWKTEGPAKADFCGDNLIVDAINAVPPNSTLWYDRIFTGSIKINYSACILAPVKASNINLFFYFDDGGLTDINRIKTADYKLYHNHQTYILTYLSENKDEIRIRLRKCPGFVLLKEAYMPGIIEENAVQNLEITMFDGKLTFAANGTELLEYFDDRPYTAGKIGLRTWNTKLAWSGFHVRNL